MKILLIVIAFFSKLVFAFDQSTMIESNWSGSLMYKKEDFQLLNEAITAYKININKISTNSNDTKLYNQHLQEQELQMGGPRFSPSFFLNAIVYESNTSWIIWLNDIKFVSNLSLQLRGIEALKLEEIKPNYAKFSLIISDLKELSPNWEKQLATTDQKTYHSADNMIIYYPDEKKIIFFLNPNQTFDLYDMEVIYGRRPFHPLNRNEN